MSLSFQRITSKILHHHYINQPPRIIPFSSGSAFFSKHSTINSGVWSRRNVIGGEILTKSFLPQLSHLQKRFIAEDNETKSLTIWQDLKHLKSSPKPALILGLSGLIPFISAPLYLLMTQTYIHDIAFGQMVYGATMLSFLGGVRWGFVITKDHLLNWFNMGYSVTPLLIGWIGLLFPFPVGMLTIIAGLATSAYFDTMLRGYPPWFKGLRFTLSFFAILSLWTTFVCKYMLKTKDTGSLEPKS